MTADVWCFPGGEESRVVGVMELGVEDGVHRRRKERGQNE